ncbi:hypothetical protein [Azospirillum canadense]|uniref:hypothetical protein n=1 Tax=Azospirillum canadense TaxID=403962 RepID=UPI0022272DD0|nr:hypothetical protein [Azospirillum canadense]MCW2239608.1 hypothetical protein [Azospirillum canadense]
MRTPDIWQCSDMPSQADVLTAERLRRARERAGYAGARAAADAFGWPDYPLDESGQRVLTAIRAKLYAHAFHVDPDWLMSGGTEPATGPDGAASGAPASSQSTDELAERISRLTDAQRAALAEFLRVMEEHQGKP